LDSVVCFVASFQDAAGWFPSLAGFLLSLHLRFARFAIFSDFIGTAAFSFPCGFLKFFFVTVSVCIVGIAQRLITVPI